MPNVPLMVHNGDTIISGRDAPSTASRNGFEKNVMNSSVQELPVIYLKAGEIHYSEQSVSVYTVLGSCLAVTMFHRRLGVGAICHGVLPECREKQRCCGDCPAPGKYVDCAIQWMVKRFKQNGMLLHDIEIKVFGGADTLNTGSGSRGGILVGKRNVASAMQVLQKEGLSILSIDVGGTSGRKLYFNTLTGEVLLKRLQPRVILADAERRE
jgi:chemotaxis protein CheD